jgi:alkyl sulfatase BDS1-like metallo-beta-lactamase superfamily hydrolase
MKLEELKKLNSAGPAATAAATFQTDAVFAALGQALKGNPDVVKKVNGVYLFKITSGSDTKLWTVDLKNGAGGIYEGEQGKPDCTITISDDDYVAMITGKTNGQQLFMGGKLKIAGNMALGMSINSTRTNLRESGALTTLPTSTSHET